MSSNSVPESRSSDDLTRSQLDEFDSDSEPEITDDILPSIRDEIKRIAISLETISNIQKKIGENTFTEMKKINEHILSLEKEHNNEPPRSWYYRVTNNRKDWVSYVYISLNATLALTAAWALHRILSR